MKSSTIFWIFIACILAFAAIPRFVAVAELKQATKRVQVFAEAITTYAGVDADGDSVELLKLPVHYELRDSVAAATKVQTALAVWATGNPWLSFANEVYEYRDKYFDNDSTIISAEYYVIEPTPVGYK
ncbi:MAG: hypothetical protein WCV85_02630 [Patescibacteria group bacterium]|jgi:hypothetical protein